ncbi:hypothetical protein Tco_0496534 [Tanacetum coccineum]
MPATALAGVVRRYYTPPWCCPTALGSAFVLIPERVTEIDGEIDSFFNGYLLNPSDDDNTTLGDLHGWHDDDVNDGENVEFSGKNDNGSDNNTDKEDENDVNVIASDGFPNLDKSNGPRIPATSPEAYSDDGSTSAVHVVKDKDYTNANADFFGSTRLKSTSQELNLMFTSTSNAKDMSAYNDLISYIDM